VCSVGWVSAASYTLPVSAPRNNFDCSTPTDRCFEYPSTFLRIRKRDGLELIMIGLTARKKCWCDSSFHLSRTADRRQVVRGTATRSTDHLPKAPERSV
jgi:hypothetical protein